MSAFHTIARSLSANGYGVPHDGKEGFSYFEKDGILIMNEWTGYEYSDATYVANGLREGGTIAAISDRVVFAIDQNNILRCYMNTRDDEEDEPWRQTSLGGGNVKVHPTSQLAINSTVGQSTVFYQDSNGSLSSIIKYGPQDWRVVKLPVGSVLPGTPMNHLSTAKEYFFYVASDMTLHHLSRDTAEAEWKDAQFAPAKLESYSYRLATAIQSDSSDGPPMVFVLGDGKLHLVRPGEFEMQLLGTVSSDGEYQPIGRQERVRSVRDQLMSGYGYPYGSRFGSTYGWQFGRYEHSYRPPYYGLPYGGVDIYMGRSRFSRGFGRHRFGW